MLESSGPKSKYLFYLCMFLLKHWNLGIKFQKLKNPISTRWNSAFTNMSSVLHLKAPLQSLFGLAKLARLRSHRPSTLSSTASTPFIKLSISSYPTAATAGNVPLSTWPIKRFPMLSFLLQVREWLCAILANQPRGQGMNSLERGAVNYLDPILTGVHLSLYAMMWSTKLEMEVAWSSLTIICNQHGYWALGCLDLRDGQLAARQGGRS